MSKVFKVDWVLKNKIAISPAPEELNYCIDIINELKEFQPTLVHCYAAMERSPLVCIAYLMKEKNITKQVALEYLMQVHPGTSPLPEQLDVLNYLN